MTPPHTAVPLRPYQDEALAAVGQAFRAGQRRPLIGLPTGTGKTVVFGTLAARAHAKSGWRVLILAHRDELIQQAVDKLCMIRPDLAMYIGVVKASRNEWERDIVVASVQSLHARRLAQIPRDRFDLIIIDEAHHAAADSYLRIARHFNALPATTAKDGEWEQGVEPFDGPVPMLLGVTATPERADSKNLADVWDGVAYHRSILDMIAGGYLCDLKGLRVELDVDLDGVKQSRGDFQDGALGEALEAADAPHAAVRSWLEHARPNGVPRQTIVFTPTIELSKLMVEAFQEAGVAAEHLDGTTPTDERRAIIKRLGSGETTVVSNCGVLTEGFDEPIVSCIIMARPTKSRVLYVQCVGRGTRLHATKAEDGATPGCLVIDLMGNTRRHTLLTVPRLMGEPGADGDAALDPEIVSEMEDEGLSVFEALERQAEAIKSGRLKAVQVDLFRRRAGNWIQATDTVWTLGGKINAEQQPDRTWSVVVRERYAAPRVVQDGLSLEYAQGRAEDEARTMDLGKLIDRGAAWRQRDASDRQRKALWRLGERKLSKAPGLTAGEASDALDAAIAAKRAG